MRRHRKYTKAHAEPGHGVVQVPRRNFEVPAVGKLYGVE